MARGDTEDAEEGRTCVMTPETDDSLIERFARVTPPTGHEARVCARSGPGAVRTAGTARTPAPAVAWRWVLPVAASTLVVVGAVWQSRQAARDVLLFPPAASHEWGGKGVDVPVLPPRAYWEMSPFEEFERLRPSRPQSSRVGRTWPDRERPRPVLAYTDAERPWEPLPPVDIVDITPSPLDVPPLPPLTPIDIPAIEIAPIEIVPHDQEQK